MENDEVSCSSGLIKLLSGRLKFGFIVRSHLSSEISAAHFWLTCFKQELSSIYQQVQSVFILMPP